MYTHCVLEAVAPSATICTGMSGSVQWHLHHDYEVIH